MTEQDGTVFLIDDDAGVRDSLGLLLSLKGIRTQLFASAESFISAYRPDWHGCVLTDLRMPGMSGLELQSALQQRQIDLPVVVLTAHGDVAATRTALKNGALDFLEKPIEDDILLEVLQNALRLHGERRVSANQRTAVSGRFARLTAREREILTLLTAGQQNVDIAAQLGISPRTVEVHKARIMEKLDCRTLADLIRFSLTTE
ncbi:MAG: two component transcriptional regulator, LuxR family [Gammaproteobacteria bacterium]|nr:two component transcriptional regulator, LuxR family [Gammaproteobacteria bacterium]